MIGETLKKTIMLISMNFLLCTLITCGSTSGGSGVITGNTKDGKHAPQVKKSPPSHAPAHGYRAKFQYQYYSSYSVYFDIDRKLYFYLAGDDWQVTATLPADLKLKLSSYVVLEMDTDRPYLHHKEYKQKYPPGKKKKQ